MKIRKAEVNKEITFPLIARLVLDFFLFKEEIYV